MQEGAITYDGLPLASGGAHRLRTRETETAANSLQSFVRAVSCDCVPSELQLEVLTDAGPIVGHFAGLIAANDARYGERRVQAVGTRRAHRWIVPSSAFHELVATTALNGGEPRAGSTNSLTVLASWTIVLTEPKSGQLLPHQDPQDYGGFGVGDGRLLGRSSLFARLGQKTTANLWLSLPFQEPTEEARMIARHVQTHFPCQLSQKQWKQWVLTRAGTYKARKIAPPI
jgi:hypothetical protein